MVSRGYGPARKRRYAWFFALYIEYIDRKARRDAPGRIYMSVNIHKISHNLEISRISRVRTYATIAAGKECRCRLSDPRRGRGPPPGRARAARSRPGAATAPNGGNLAPARSPAARELYQRPRGRLPAAPTAAEGVPRAPQTLLLAPRPAPAARASVRRLLRPARPPGGRPRPAGLAPLARGGGAAAPLGSAPARQTGRGKSWATRLRVPGGVEAAEKSTQLNSSQ